MNEAEPLELARRASGGPLWLDTFRRNAHACPFYERRGFGAVAVGFEPQWQLDAVRYAWARAPQPAP